uniref:Paired domain-containing protein n=1 Tax=Globodera rostochiensis TaxID=31243 RepID=A0A914I205_GLORO
MSLANAASNHHLSSDPFNISLLVNHSSIKMLLEQQQQQFLLSATSNPTLLASAFFPMPSSFVPLMPPTNGGGATSAELLKVEDEQQQHEQQQPVANPFALQQQTLERIMWNFLAQNMADTMSRNCNSSSVLSSGLFQQQLANLHDCQALQQQHLANHAGCAAATVSTPTEDCWTSTLRAAAAASAPQLEPVDNINKMSADQLESISRNKLGRSYNPGRPLGMLDRQKILNLYQKGLKISHIAKLIGVTHSCVSKIMTRYRRTGSIYPRSAQLIHRRHHHQQQQCTPISLNNSSTNAMDLAAELNLVGHSSEHGTLPSAFRPPAISPWAQLTTAFSPPDRLGCCSGADRLGFSGLIS